jgi:hypothetical protein
MSAHTSAKGVQSRLVVLNLSFVEVDPNRTFAPQVFCYPGW